MQIVKSPLVTFLFSSFAFVSIVLLCIITKWSWPNPTNTKISVTRFSVKCKHALYCDIRYICYCLPSMKNDSRTTYIYRIKEFAIFDSQKQKNEILAACSFLYFVWSSNKHQLMVQNLFKVLVYCDFAVILAHQKLCKEKKTEPQCYLIHETNSIFTQNEG